MFAVAPVCKNEDVTVVGASLSEVLRVRCHVTADPSDVSFVWQFNNSGESFEVEQSRFGTGNGSTSDLYYTPKSERDYGTLACWGRNAIGRQAEPCIFQLVPAGITRSYLLKRFLAIEFVSWVAGDISAHICMFCASSLLSYDKSCWRQI